jgi:hypothetical protein
MESLEDKISKIMAGQFSPSLTSPVTVPPIQSNLSNVNSMNSIPQLETNNLDLENTVKWPSSSNQRQEVRFQDPLPRERSPSPKFSSFDDHESLEFEDGRGNLARDNENVFDISDSEDRSFPMPGKYLFCYGFVNF